MTPLGYDRPLYLLPFDHRWTFQKNKFGWSGTLTDEQTAKIVAMKWAIYDGLHAALAAGVARANAGILVDEQFGADILRDAAKHHCVTACPAEKSGQDEFDFEHGNDFDHDIKTFRPTFCKVQVRYNPVGDAAMNRRQAERLKQLSDYLHPGGPSKFMFELLVPATPAQLERCDGDKKEYERVLRPELMTRAIVELQDAHIEPDVWKIEGIDRPEDCTKVVATVRRGGRDRVGCIALGRGEDDTRVRHWLQTAATVPGFIGFAVGLASFWGPLTEWRDGQITRDAAVSEIARRYREWVSIFESARRASGAAVARVGRA